jgi:chromate transport protein ChrA
MFYKFVKLTTDKDKQDLVLESSTNAMLAFVSMNILTILIFTKLLSYFPGNKIFFYLLYLVIPVSLFFINKLLFVKGQRYKEIETYYDKKNNLKKGHFILLAVVYMLASIGALILTGIYYNSNN